MLEVLVVNCLLLINMWLVLVLHGQEHIEPRAIFLNLRYPEIFVNWFRISRLIPDVIMEGLSRKNYAEFFSTLLAVEEIHLEEEMRTHDMELVTMKRRGNHFLSLEVPGLAEKRPSLVYGDYIFAKLVVPYSNDNKTYQGYIHKVDADQIFLKFDDEVHYRHQNKNLYNVSFTYNRTTMRRLYHAINAAANLGPNILFPSKPSLRSAIKLSPLVPINPYINKEQARSVELILSCEGGSPYVIHGLPGTGKTITLVEAILQVYSRRPKAQILVCASSNSAADNVLEKLIDVKGIEMKKSDIFRLNASSRPYEDIKPEFVQFCFFEDMVFKCPPLKALRHYRIIISTYMSAFLLFPEGM
ncbi:uncharacterized protein A4U43_C03F5200 [Asparagus officinalis]|uniref:Uncharacterized protein n=1 Tax=Asparagus officinalis TaxID=4686 RepID=A0A5P1FA92_ASPOF|nr:uncharacterized protein A4U43_C03F5200 [Asparagus officinalis]